jgi:phosphatidylethanolamine-binding protein (PEBP) family uncharacterized protein
MQNSSEELDSAKSLKNFLPLGLFGATAALALIGLFAMSSDLKENFTSPARSTTELNTKSSSSFKLYSDVMNDGGNLPYAYTCLGSDGGVSPPMQWKNAPDDTEEFMITMTTDAYLHTGEFLYTRTDWVLYNIDNDEDEIKAGNEEEIGDPGGTYPGVAKYEYSPPCPTGSGNKTYVFTIYALGGKLSNYISKEDDDAADVGPNMIELAEKKDLILATSSISTSFCMYSDDEESCTMGNYKRHQAQRPLGPDSGDVFWTKGKLHSTNERLTEKQFAADEILELLEINKGRDKALKAAAQKNAAMEKENDRKEDEEEEHEEDKHEKDEREKDEEDEEEEEEEEKREKHSDRHDSSESKEEKKTKSTEKYALKGSRSASAEKEKESSKKGRGK